MLSARLAISGAPMLLSVLFAGYGLANAQGFDAPLDRCQAAAEPVALAGCTASRIRSSMAPRPSTIRVT